MKRKTQGMVFLSIMVALAVVLSIVDKTITYAAFPYLPTAKIGLANLVVLIIMYKYSFKETFILVVLKILLANLLIMGPMSFIIGGPSSLMSFLVMYLLYFTFSKNLSPIGISVAGGFTHIVVQLVITFFVYELGDVVMIYGAILVIVSLITSTLIGLLVLKLNQQFFQQEA